MFVRSQRRPASIARPGAGEEFLDGCLRLKGFARSIDVHFIMAPGPTAQKTPLYALVHSCFGLRRSPERFRQVFEDGF